MKARRENKMIKLRKAKKSDRGIYIQDIELMQTDFKVGSHFKYVIDQQKKQIVILPSTEENQNTVSKRSTKKGLKPVIDIRNKKALEVFGQADYLQVEINEDKIVVSGYDEKEDTLLSKLSSKFNRSISKKKNVVDITSLLNVKKKFEFQLSKQELDEAVGQHSYQQLSIFDVIDNTNSFTKSSIDYVKKAIGNIQIPLQIISLFSGSGVMDTGFVEEGFNVNFALEIDEDAVKTYKANHGDHIERADITTFDKKRFAEIGSPIVIGGSPCQGFSLANRHSNFLDNPNNLLVKEFIESVKANPECQVFVLENVPQLLTAGNGQFKQEIFSELSEFEMTSGTLTATDFGDPQERKRAFIIGSKIGKIELPKATHTTDNYVTVEQAFQGLHDQIENQLDYSKPRADTIERMKHIKQGENWKALPFHLKTDKMHTGNTHSTIYRRLELDKSSFTIVNTRKSNIIHPTENRSLSVRESARLFSVKDDYIFKGTLASKQQQIANSVPVKMVRAIAKEIKKVITNYNSLVNRNSFSLV
jgi:DNA (cytosine-5)-methyltransferase 1